jgi:hypothetical protein
MREEWPRAASYGVREDRGKFRGSRGRRKRLRLHEHAPASGVALNALSNSSAFSISAFFFLRAA